MESKMTVTKELIKEKFSDDALFIANMVKSKDDLFPDFLETLYVDEQYTTKKAAELIGSILEKGSENNIRYYMRSTNLESYIEPLQLGRNLRLLYTSIYKLYLISLYLSADEQRNLLDIKEILPNFTVQPVVKTNKANAETSVGEARSEYYKYTLLALAYSNQNKVGMQQVGNFVSDLWNDFIDNVQLNQQLNTKMDDILSLRNRLSNEESKLILLKNELIDEKNNLRNQAQFNNIQKVYQEIKSYKEENSSIMGRLFPKKKKEDDVEFFSVKDNEPKLIDLKEQIEKQEDVVLKIQEDLAEREKERKDLISKQKIPDQARLDEMKKLLESIHEEPVLDEKMLLKQLHNTKISEDAQNNPTTFIDASVEVEQ